MDDFLGILRERGVGELEAHHELAVRGAWVLADVGAVLGAVVAVLEAVVDLVRGEVAAAGLGLAVDCLGEVVVGAGIDARAKQVDFAVGPSGPHLRPLGHLALGIRGPELLQLGGGDRIHPRRLGVHRHGNAVVGDGQLDVLDAGLAARFDFGGLDRPGGIADVCFGAAELLEPATRARNADGDLDACFGLLEFLGDGFTDREDRARTIQGDEGRATRRRSRRTTGPGILGTLAARGQGDDRNTENRR